MLADDGLIGRMLIAALGKGWACITDEWNRIAAAETVAVQKNVRVVMAP